MRITDQEHNFDTTAVAPYVATLLLAEGATLSLALPGVGERMLARPAADGATSRLELIPPSSTWSAEPEINPAGRAALASWQAGGGVGALRLRHEKGLGGETGLGDVAAAVAAGALAGSALAGGVATADQIQAWLSTVPHDPITDGRGALDAALMGGAIIHTTRGSRPVAALTDLNVVVVLPGLATDGGPAGPLARPDVAAMEGAIEVGHLSELMATTADLQAPGEPWQSALTAARGAVRTGDAGWVGVAAGGQVLVGLVTGKAAAMAMRSAVIDAFAELGVWSRGRAGGLDRAGARSGSGRLQP